MKSEHIAKMQAARKSAPPAEAQGKQAQEALSGRSESQRADALKRLARTPVTCRGVYLRAVAGKAAPRAAIKAFCLECIGYDREAVAGCTAPACPLFLYRPFRKSEP